MIARPPAHATVAVIGGGPGGAMAAILLAREGIEVVVCERDTFPRYHIGESLLTAAIPILKFVDLYDQVDGHGFLRKHGGYFILRKGAPPGHIDFRKVGAHAHSYQVIRADFDHLLLRHAAASGAAVFEATAVTEVEFEGPRAIALRWRQGDGADGRMTFDHVIDASGLAGLVTTRSLHNRRFQEAFANVAIGAYWRGFAPYVAPDGQPQAGDFFMEALVDGSGWAWAIPLHDGTLSVGVVLHQREYRRLRAELGESEAIYAAALAKTPELTTMLAAAERGSPLRTWQDFSYIADRFAGPGYRLVGDAAAFIDPLFSTGVHMAFLGALAAAASIASELREGLANEVAARFHDRCIRGAYARFAVVVAGMYKQIRAQETAVLYGIDRADFARAFAVILPVLTGAADLPELGELSDEVLRRAIDFTIDMTNERAQLGTDNRAAELLVAEGAHEDLAASPEDAVDGRYIRLQRGALGLAAVGAEQDELDRRIARLRDRLVEAAAGQ